MVHVVLGSSRQRKQRWSVVVALGLIASFVAVAPATVARAADPALPAGFRVMEYARNLNKPTAMAFAPDGRLFVTEKEGTLRVISPSGVLRPTPVLTLSVDFYRERGLLDVVFDPAFPTNGYTYIYYTSPVGGCHNQVSRFTMTGNTIDPATELQLIDIGPCGSGGHNGGGMHFSNDGKLFIQVGEQNVSANAQSLNNLFGKVLRINPDGSIPTGNPFYAYTTGRNQAIWALGFRNPFSGGVDPVTGDLFVNDVGSHTWEEINNVKRGENHGWPTTEGDFDPATYPQFTRPVSSYTHGSGTFEGCAIVGGAFYRSSGGAFPARFEGDWLFADYCNSYMHVLDRATGQVSEFLTNADLIVDIDVGPDGNVYYLNREGGPLQSFVERIDYSPLPGISKQPTSVSATQGNPVQFRVVASGDGPTTYQWYRNGVALAGATLRTLDFTATTANNGASFFVRVGNAAGNIDSASVTLTVGTVSNTAPTVSIQAPIDQALYSGDDVVSFAGTGNDAEDGPLPASAFTWEVEFHHAQHIHPFLEPFSGVKSGTFRIPNNDETATDVYYRVHLTVTDSFGDSSTTFVDIIPRVVTIRLATLPTGRPVEVGGAPTATPSAFTSVVGVKQMLNAPPTANVNGKAWAFDTWFDATPEARTIVTAVGNRTYVANYHVAGGSVGKGTGLVGTYYDNPNFTGATNSRRDRVINFTWRDALPAAGIAPSAYSVRWTGTLKGQFSQQYTFTATVKGSAKLIVGGQTVINASSGTLPAELTGTINLVAGQNYPIVFEYSAPSTTGIVMLDWASASTPRSPVPRSQLS